MSRYFTGLFARMPAPRIANPDESFGACGSLADLGIWQPH